MTPMAQQLTPSPMCRDPVLAARTPSLAAAGGFGRSLRQSPVLPALTCDSTAIS